MLLLGFVAARLMPGDAREETGFFKAPLLIWARASLMSLVTLLVVAAVAGTRPMRDVRTRMAPLIGWRR